MTTLLEARKNRRLAPETTLMIATTIEIGTVTEIVTEIRNLEAIEIGTLAIPNQKAVAATIETAVEEVAQETTIRPTTIRPTTDVAEAVTAVGDAAAETTTIETTATKTIAVDAVVDNGETRNQSSLMMQNWSKASACSSFIRTVMASFVVRRTITLANEATHLFLVR